jgi:hypothetical protein
MKLWNVTSAVALGALFVFGCSVESTPSTDGGTSETGTDTGAKVDTGTATDTGTMTTDTGMAGETGMDCATCQKEQCKTEQAACQADMTKLKGCNDLIMCINGCSDTACANKCISDSMSTEGKALLACVQDKCAAACGG